MPIRIKKKSKLKIKKKKYKPTKIGVERRRRINVALWAYAYEVHDNPLVDDAKFDEVCEEIDLSVSTGNKKMDTWFRRNFDLCTGSWIHKHPDLKGLEILYRRLIKTIK